MFLVSIYCGDLVSFEFFDIPKLSSCELLERLFFLACLVWLITLGIRL